jgi:ABC-type antimicrobial peptide transport system permease subunit
LGACGGRKKKKRKSALRKVLGAGHARLARQLITESAVLAAIGAVLGVALSVATFTYLARLLPSNLPATSMLRIDSSVMLFTAGVAALIVLVIGSAPSVSCSSDRTGGSAAIVERQEALPRRGVFVVSS